MTSSTFRQLEEQASDRVEISGPQGGLCMFSFAETFCFSRTWGRMGKEHAKLIMEFTDGLFARGGERKQVQVHDWFAMTGYDGAARVRLTMWLAKRLRTIEASLCGTSSSVVTMGLTIANLAVGNIIGICGSPEALDAALQKRLQLAGHAQS